MNENVSLVGLIGDDSKEIIFKHIIGASNNLYNVRTLNYIYMYIKSILKSILF